MGIHNIYIGYIVCNAKCNSNTWSKKNYKNSFKTDQLGLNQLGPLFGKLHSAS